MPIPFSLQPVFQNLPTDTQGLVWQEYERRRKSGGLAYVLWFPFGFHYLYLGQIGLQLLYWLTFGGLGFWAIIDLFRIPAMVGRKNEEIFYMLTTSISVPAHSGMGPGAASLPAPLR
jgi:TM2 domain-containing membrane protein YozV